VLANIQYAVDNGDLALLTLLDLSAAFDTGSCHVTLLRYLDVSAAPSTTGWHPTLVVVGSMFVADLQGQCPLPCCSASRKGRFSVRSF
jgi:hypothetical protein